MTISSDKIARFEEGGDTAGHRVERKAIEDSLKKYSLTGLKSFLEGLKLVNMDEVPDFYSIFIFGQLHNLNLGLSWSSTEWWNTLGLKS